MQIPSDQQKYPCVHQDTKGWTALSLATVHGHLAVVQVRTRGKEGFGGGWVRVGVQNGQNRIVGSGVGAGTTETE